MFPFSTNMRETNKKEKMIKEMSVLHWYLSQIGAFKHNKTFDIFLSVCRWGDYDNLVKNPHI